MNTRPDPKRHTGGVVLQDAGASPSTAAVAGTIVPAESCDPALLARETSTHPETRSRPACGDRADDRPATVASPDAPTGVSSLNSAGASAPASFPPVVADAPAAGSNPPLPSLQPGAGASPSTGGSAPIGRSHQRHRRGLTDEQVVDIRRRWAAGETVRSLAAAFRVSTNTVHAAATGRRYGDVPGKASPRKRFPHVKEADLRRLAENGATQAAAARALGVTPPAIHTAGRRYGVDFSGARPQRLPDLSDRETEDYLFLTRKKRLSRDEALAAVGRPDLDRRPGMTTQQKTRKLSDAEVVAMRARRRSGEKIAAIARAFGVSHSTASQACSGRLYREIPGAIPRGGISLPELREMAVCGGPKSTAAERFGVTLSAVCSAIRRHGIQWGQA